MIAAHGSSLFPLPLLRFKCRQAELTLREFPGSLLVRIPGLSLPGAPVLSLLEGIQPTSLTTRPIYSRLRVGLTPLTLQFPGL